MDAVRVVFENKRLAFFGIFLVTIFTYLPSLGGTFLHTDDWFWSYWGGFSCPGVVNWILPIGRPLAGLIYCVFPLVTQFKWVWIFRLIGILNIGYIGCLLWKWMVRFRVESIAAFLVSILVIALPAFHVYSSYISTLPHGFAVTTSFLAAFAVDRAFSNTNRNSKIGWGLLGALLLICSLCLNQASALYYVGVLAVPVLMSDSKNFMKEQFRRLAGFAAILASAAGVYYLCFRISAKLFHFRDVGKYDGRNFVQDYGQRIKWFYNNPLLEAGNLWSVNPSRLFFSLVLLTLIIWFVWDFLREDEKRGTILKYFTAAALLPAGYGISLMSSDPSKEYRTYAVLGSTFVFLLFLGFYSIEWRRFRGRVRNSILIAFSAIAILASLVAHKTVAEYFVFSDTAEFQYVKNEIRNHLARGKDLKWIHVVVAQGPIAAPRQRNEIGEPTLRHTPNIEPLIWAALSELGLNLRPKVTTGQSLGDKNWVELIFDHQTIDLRQDPYPPAKEGVLLIDISGLRLR